DSAIMQALADQPLDTNRKNARRLSSDDINAYRQQLPAWEMSTQDVPRLYRTFTFRNFAEALQFTNQVGALAEEADHHPALLTEWGKVTASWWTHSIGGLHQNDFIMAARCDALFEAGRKA